MPRGATPELEQRRRDKISATLKRLYQAGLRQPQRATKGRPLSEEHKRKIGEAQRGRLFSAETRLKMSLRKKEQGIYPSLYFTEEIRARIRAHCPFAKLWEMPEYRSRYLSHLAKLNSGPEQKARASMGGKAVWAKRGPEMLARLRVMHSSPKTAETRRKLSEATKKQWAKSKRQMVLSQRRGLKKPNRKEAQLLALLEQIFPQQWRYVGNGGAVVGNLVPDFISAGDEKLLIELFGAYWHSELSQRPFTHAEEREEVFRQHGYKMLVIWDYELKDEAAVILKVRRFLDESAGETETALVNPTAPLR